MRRCWLFLALFAFDASVAQQASSPHAAYVYPAGGRQGTTFDVTVGGQYLEGAKRVGFAGKGVQAEVIDFQKPLNGKELDAVRTRLKDLTQSHTNAPAAAPPNGAAAPAGNGQKAAEALHTKPWTPEDRELAADLRRQIEQTTRLRAVPALAQSVKLRVSIAPDAIPGDHELRLITNKGITNPLTFLVDRLPEFAKPAQFVPQLLAAGGGLPLNAQAHADITHAPQAIDLPVVLNGQMMPGGADRYRFHARKGQKIVIAAQTRMLVPFMADAVPGWFQAALTLSDASGKELAYADHFRFSQEPVLMQVIPADGDYVLSVRDILNRGREDFVYRITIGELPFVSGIFPLGGRAENAPPLELSGWNLDNKTTDASVAASGVHFVLVGDYDRNLNHLLSIPLSEGGDLPAIIEKNPAADVAHARPVTLPVIVDGRIERPGSVAYVRINARAGEEMVAEVKARRLGSPLDSTLMLLDAGGRQLAFNDDAPDKGAAMLTDQADSLLSYRFSTAGVYYLRVADSKHNGGTDYAYRLRISHPQPDFEVRIAPSGVNLRPGRTIPVNVQLLRRDGFTGDVKLNILAGPQDLTLSGASIPANTDNVRIGLTAPAQGIASPSPLVIEGVANIGGKIVRHRALPVDDYIQAFAWHAAVPAQQGMVWIVGKEHRLPMWTTAITRAELPVGGTGELRFEIPQAWTGGQINLTLDDPPPGISLAKITQSGNVLQVVLQTDDKASPGLAGNLILEASLANSDGKTNPTEILPAVPFEVVLPPR